MKTLLKNIAEIQIGYQARGRIEPNPGGAFHIIQVKDFDHQNELMLDTIYRTDVERDPEKYRVQTGDVLFVSRGFHNFAVAIDLPLENTLASNTFYILRVDAQRILPGYLAWTINQSQCQLKAMTQAQNIPLIPKAAFERLEIDLPPLSVQHKVLKLLELMKQERDLNEKRADLIQAACIHAARQD
jgi:restriction endonuclease S subunit